MAGIPSTSMQGQPPCMYNDPNVYIKNEYDQGEIYSVNKLVSFFEQNTFLNKSRFYASRFWVCTSKHCDRNFQIFS